MLMHKNHAQDGDELLMLDVPDGLMMRIAHEGVVDDVPACLESANRCPMTLMADE